MRFDPYPRLPARSPSRRRLSQAARAIAKERAAWGMFAGQMGPTETPEERIARVDAGGAEAHRQMRDLHAQLWRRARRILFGLPETQRRALVAEWNGSRWLPGSPEYLLDMLHRKGVADA